MKTRLNLELIKEFVEEDKLVISTHARVRMFQRNVSTDDIKSVVIKGEIIEEYINDEPCPSALILGFSKNIPYHVVVAECEDHVRIVTVYIPEEDKWIRYRIRRG
ncbi:hypothetical protein C4E24_02540 [ANME-1 cluster archaeon AG-394-G21]|nr:hypothetical protein [ANME-1 cluster archaeon AG-394-G21]